MTNTYDTSAYPLGSTHPKVLFNNASNLDEYMNSFLPSIKDRFDRRRETLEGLKKMVTDFLEAMGFEATHLVYVDGTPLQVDRPTQLIDRAGSVYKVKQPATFPVTLSGTWATDVLLLVDVGDASLRMALAAAGGSALVGDGTSTVADELQLLRDQVSVVRTVEYYGAAGDGVTDDTTAFEDMFATTGGVIRLGPNKAYMVNGLALTGPYVSIQGAEKPVFNTAYTQLQNGSILIGAVSIRSNVVDVQRFGVDAGSARGVSASDGFVINAIVGELGKKVVAKDIIVLGTNETSSTHALLIQGYEHHEVENNDTALHQFGVVVKGRNGFVRNTTGYRIKTATVYAKSDAASVGGDVADATCGSLIIDGVVSTANPANTECNHVYVHGSTLSINKIIVENVQGTFGNSALRIAGGSDTSLVSSGVQFSNIHSEKGVRAVDMFGYNYDTVGNNVSAVNPSSGEAVSTSGNSYNYMIDGINVLISDAAIVATSCSSFNGVGGFDNLTVRNPYLQMIVNINIANCVAGAIQGDAKLSGTGALTLSNSWGAGTQAPVVLSGARNLISCRGWVTAAGASSNTIASFPLSQSPERLFSCAARKTDTTYTTVVLYLSGTALILQGDRSVLDYIDLSGVVFQA